MLVLRVNLSIRITLAPKSANTIPANGAGANPAISITFIPSRGNNLLVDAICRDDHKKFKVWTRFNDHFI